METSTFFVEFFTRAEVFRAQNRPIIQWPASASTRAWRRASRSMSRARSSGCAANRRRRATTRACLRSSSFGAASRSTRLEPNPVRYAERMGIAVDGRLTAEGQPPSACLGLLVQEWGAELAVAEWKLRREEAALADDPLEAGLAALEKIEERPLAKTADQKPRSAAKKKPSAAPAKKNTNRCVGRGGDLPCVYNLQQPGERGVYNSRGGSKKCVFCDDHAMRTACSNAAGRSNILGNLKKLRAVYEEKPHIYNSALLRVPDARREEIHKKVAADTRPRAAARRERAKPKPAPARAARTSWATALASRKRAWRPLTAAEAKKYKKRVKTDRKRVQQKFFEAHDIEAPPAEDIADNDAGLPAPARSEQGRFVELWAKFGSWGICKDCRSLQPRCLEPIDCRRVAKPEIAPRACKACQNSKVSIPKFEDIPQPLRALSKDAVQALRPLDIDSGPYRRAAYGYRVHSAMIRLAWAAESIPEKISQLPRDERRAARAAYEFLMASEESAYSDFAEKHSNFLRREGEEVAEQRRKRPLQFLETPGLENALWPNLYWTEEMCETSIRASDVRRQRRRNAADPAQEVGGPRPEQLRLAAGDSGSEEEEGGEDSGRQSIKKSFMKKVLGPIAGYAEDFELLQFVYDLSLWSRIGGGKNACKHIPLRLVLKGETFSPLYFKTRHAALIDLQRQCGHPQIFKTMAPWEPSFPYHFWILNKMSQAGRRRGGSTAEGEPEQELAGLETLHHAHVFTELERGLYTGMNKRSSADGGDAWKSHLLGPSDNGAETSQAFFFRLEYQDGKRKAATQAYHGSGRVHCHSLNYMREPKRAKLEKKIRATEPAAEEAALRGYVLGRPRREGAPTGWPIQEEESHWDDAAQLLRFG